jgi:hypothetical protein
MAKIIFIGWQVGMRTIPFIRLLTKKAGLSLANSKKIKDRIVDNNERIEIIIKNDKLAKEILIEAHRYGVKCELVK